jgi:hypothetical protein
MMLIEMHRVVDDKALLSMGKLQSVPRVRCLMKCLRKLIANLMLYGE